MVPHTRRRTTLVAGALIGALLFSAPAASQTPTGLISGHVTDTSHLPMPGVTVAVSSPSLQGTRSATSSDNGDFSLPLLPPGRYSIVFARPGFADVKETRDLGGTQTMTLNVTMTPAAVRESISVTGRANAFSNAAQAVTHVQQDTLASLPTSRTLLAAVNLAPAVHGTGPSNNVSIAGAMSFENLFLLNGVPILDNIRHTPLSPFIEDAIQETTVATSGISAEYGRFTGGVVNAITRSGGNDFAGSVRLTLNNDDWRTTSPFGEPKVNKTVPTYEGTLGGAIMRDRLWFFAAGRSFDRKTANETGFTRVPYTNEVKEQRAELKLTGRVGTRHTLQGSYTSIQRKEVNNAFQSPSLVMDAASLVTRTLPQSLASLHYSGIFGSRLFLEAQASSRELRFEGDGGTSRDLVRGTVLLDQQTGARWWSPALCGVCAPFQERNSDDLLVKGHYFLSTRRGAHNVVFGYNTYNDKLEGDNHQSGSDYQVWTAGSVIQNGDVYPVLDNRFNTFILWFPIAESSHGTDFRTHGLFVNDAWQVNSHWTFNLGLRWDKNHGSDSAGQVVARDGAVSPRLGFVWDPTGQGGWSVHGSYGEYVAQIATTIGLSASPAGIPGVLGYFYQGPAINTTAGAPLVSSEAALQTLFTWFNGNGGTNRQPFVADLPGVATKFGGSLKSPRAREAAGGLTRLFGRGAIRADLVYRTYGDFYSERIDAATGRVEARGQLFDLKLIENTDAVSRQYAALNLQANARLGTRLSIGGTYTLSRLWGNINGESAPAGPLGTTDTSYREFFDAAWSNPVGDLSADQRHRARVWGTWLLADGDRLGRVSVGVLEQVESGSPYGAVGGVRTGAFVSDPGYATPPDSVSYFFTRRDAFRAAAMSRTDLSVNYAHALAGSRTREVFAQAQVLNLFNQFQPFNLAADAINTTVLTAVDNPARFAPFNPFVTAPVQGVNWDYGANFGKPISARAYTLPRTFQMAVGVRF